MRPRVADTVAAVVLAVHCFAAGTRASGPSRLHPRALLRCSAVRQPGTQGQRRRFTYECGGRRNQRGPMAPAPRREEEINSNSNTSRAAGAACDLSY